VSCRVVWKAGWVSRKTALVASGRDASRASVPHAPGGASPSRGPEQGIAQAFAGALGAAHACVMFGGRGHARTNMT